MQNRPNYYRLLHVQADAPTAIIKASHRTLMQRLKMHPDLGGDHAQAVLLNEALATLTDPDKRAAYDRTLAHNERPQTSRETPAATTARSATTSPRARAPRPTLVCRFCAAPAASSQADWPDATCHDCGSALFPAQKHQSGESSRRAFERLPRSMPMTFRRSAARHTSLAGTTEDVSLNGARFLARVRLQVGECLSLECQFCSAIAIVKSVQPSAAHGAGGSQVGVEFVTLRFKHARGGLVSTVA